MKILAILLGFLSAYGQVPTEGTIAIRQEWGQLPQDMSQYDGVIATKSCALIGHEATLYIQGEKYDVIVFDCSGDQETSEWMLSGRIIAELGYFLSHKIPNYKGKWARIVIHKHFLEQATLKSAR